MCITKKETVKIKTVMVSLWSEVGHLTDSCLEAVKVCQSGNRNWEAQGSKLTVASSKYDIYHL